MPKTINGFTVAAFRELPETPLLFRTVPVPDSGSAVCVFFWDENDTSMLKEEVKALRPEMSLDYAPYMVSQTEIYESILELFIRKAQEIN